MKVVLQNNDADTVLRLCAAAGLLSRTEGKVTEVIDSVFQKDIEAILKTIKFISGLGHSSIVENDYFIFALEDVPVLIEQLIIQSRFCAFTIKSRREANFSKEGFYVPDFKDEVLKKQYVDHMQSLFNDYDKLVELGIKKEDARYILPYCFNSQMLMGMNANELSKLINKLTNSEWAKIPVVKEFGEMLREAAVGRSSYIDGMINKYKDQNDSPIKNAFSNIRIIDDNYKIIDKPVILSHTPDIDKSIIVNEISKLYQYSIEESNAFYDQDIKGNNELIETLFKSFRDDNNKEALSHISLTVQMPISFANLTHISRHRTTKLLIPDFGNNINLSHYKKPSLIAENIEADSIFENAFSRNIKVFEEFKKADVPKTDLPFFTLSGNLVNIVVTFDGETLRHVSSLRACNKAQWEIRELISSIVDDVAKIAPNYYKIIGANCEVSGFCPEGKESCKKLKPRKF